jgi:cytoskeleton protein RodZ
MTDIGATLREARMRARIDVSEIEAKTKIRARYLRALENEEWDLLPGPTFVRSFLRTYAQALGLDAKALVEEYRVRYEPPVDPEHQPGPRRPRPRPGGRPGVGKPSRGYVAAVSAVGVVIALLVYGLLAGGKGKSPATKSAASGQAGVRSLTAHAHRRHRAARSHARRVALSLQPSGPVYVCLIGDGGRKLIPGLTLEPSYTPVTYRASRFAITLGNSSVTMYVDGRARTVPPSSRAIGYSVTSDGRRSLAAGQMPTCK